MIKIGIATRIAQSQSQTPTYSLGGPPVMVQGRRTIEVEAIIDGNIPDIWDSLLHKPLFISKDNSVYSISEVNEEMRGRDGMCTNYFQEMDAMGNNIIRASLSFFNFKEDFEEAEEIRIQERILNKSW